MNSSDIRRLANENENQILEFKAYKRTVSPDIYETVCSFANREGGNIIIGIDDKTHAIVGVPESDIDQMQKDFTNGVANPQKIFPRLTYELQKLTVDDKFVLLTTIYPSSEVHKLNGNRIIDRQNDADIDITDTPDLVATMYLRKRDGYSENKIYPYCTLSDLNPDLIDTARKYAIAKNRDHPWGVMNNEELLQSAGLYMFDHLTGAKGYTLACILLFGKDETIMSVCPQHRTDCIKRIKDLDRYDDRDDIRTNLIDTYFRMFKFIGKHLDEAFALDENTVRYSPRDALFREAIANSIIHREYRERTVAKMIIEKERVIFENGCIPYRHGPVTLSNFSPKSKNPRIAYVFNNMGLADELGSGVRNMYKYNEIYSGGTPIIDEGDIFKTIIPLIPLLTESEVSDYKKLIIEYITKNNSINRTEAISLTHLGKTKLVDILNELITSGLVSREGNGPATKYVIK
jgi:ATP-dependent DNA helicase RecG